MASGFRSDPQDLRHVGSWGDSEIRSKTIGILIVGIMFGVPAVVTEAFGVDVKVTCPSKSCPCTTVKVHECDAKSDGTLYNCHDVDELQCTVSGKTVKVHTK